MNYPAKFSRDNIGYTVTFRDIPEAITNGETMEEARVMAADALLTAMEFYFEDKRSVPMPSDLQSGEEWIALPASAVAKIYLLNALLESRVSNAELARRLGVSRQAVGQSLDLHRATSIDFVEKAVAALGYQLEFRVRH